MTDDRRSWLSWPTIAIVMVVLFAFSVIIRLPYLDMTMGLHHDEGTARTLVHSMAWDDEGPDPQGFLLRRTFDNPGDRFLSGNVDDQGREYYYSMPPGHPLLAYAALAITGSERDVENVRIFNLVLHAICALLAFLLASELARGLTRPWARAAGLVAFTVYLFAPTALWYQSNAYLSASAVQPFFMGTLLAAMVAYRKPGERRLVWLIGVLAFLMTYTEWLGLAFAGVALVLLIARRRDAAASPVLIAVAVGGFAAAGAFFAQYGLHLGLGELAGVVGDRYALRSGLAESSGYSLWDLEAWKRVFAHYRLGLSSTLALLGVLAVWQWVLRRRNEIDESGASIIPVGIVSALMLAPTLIHHLLLFDHTVVHSFDVLKTVVPVAVFAGVFAGRIGATTMEACGRARIAAVTGIAALVIATVTASLWLFADVRTQEPPPFDKIGAVVAENALPDEVVFLDSSAYMPRSIIAYYAKRDWVRLPERRQRIISILARNGGRTGFVVTTDFLGNPAEMSYIGADGMLYAERSEALATLDAITAPQDE